MVDEIITIVYQWFYKTKNLLKFNNYGTCFTLFVFNGQEVMKGTRFKVHTSPCQTTVLCS